MSYYQRPMGDYKTYGYAGDPGLFSFLGKIAKKAIKYLAPVLGGPLGIAASAVGGMAAGQQFAAPPSGFMPGAGAKGPSMPGFQYPATGPGGQALIPAAGVCPTGYHPDKATGTKCVRNRRMNVANPRALRRSMRRVQGFEKLAKRTIRFTRRTKMKTRSSS